jgi:hypothetical protein
LSRFSLTPPARAGVDNSAINVREWYEPIARQWLKAQIDRIGEVRLIIDGSHGVSQKIYPNCLDMGQTCSRS